jgi:hypothetical protein
LGLERQVEKTKAQLQAIQKVEMNLKNIQEGIKRWFGFN